MLLFVLACTERHDFDPVETDDTNVDSDVVDDRVWVQLNAHPCALADNGFWVGCAARDPGFLDCSNGRTYDFGTPAPSTSFSEAAGVGHGPGPIDAANDPVEPG